MSTTPGHTEMAERAAVLRRMATHHRARAAEALAIAERMEREAQATEDLMEAQGR